MAIHQVVTSVVQEDGLKYAVDLYNAEHPDNPPVSAEGYFLTLCDSFAGQKAQAQTVALLGKLTAANPGVLAKVTALLGS